MYRHTQIGWVTLIGLGAGAVFLGVMAIMTAREVPLQANIPFFLFLILLAAAILFATLTVVVDNETIEARFGPGLIRKRLRLADLEGCMAVTNRRWYGWGIRWIGKGWMYNVSGLDAVELSLRDGKVFRIGTDEPEKLSEFINEKLSRRP